MKNRYLLLVVVLIGTVCLTNICTAGIDDITDEGLQKVICRTLEKDNWGEVDKDDLPGIEKLEANESDPSILNLNGIGCLENVKSISLKKNQITVLKPLSRLVNLEELVIPHQLPPVNSELIKDLSPLSSLNKLHILVLGSPIDASLEPIKKLTELNKLTLGDNYIGFNKKYNLKPLEGLTELNTLVLGDNCIGSNHDEYGLEPIKKLTKLNTLILGSNCIGIGSKRRHSLKAIEGLKKLKILAIGDNRIGSNRDDEYGLEPIKKLTKLNTLILGNNFIGSKFDKFGLEPIKKLTELNTLILGSNYIGFNEGCNLKPLEDLTELNTLILGSNYIGSEFDKFGLKPIEGLTKLNTLVIGDNIIGGDNDEYGLKPLEGLTKLNTLVIGNNLIGCDNNKYGLEPLKAMDNLTYLAIGYSELKEDDLKPLEKLSIAQLAITYFDYEINLAPLEGLPLTDLFFEGKIPQSLLDNIENIYRTEKELYDDFPTPDDPIVTLAVKDIFRRSFLSYHSSNMLLSKGVPQRCSQRCRAYNL